MVLYATRVALLLAVLGLSQSWAQAEPSELNADFELGVSAGVAPLTLLDLDTGAACLDGTPYGFYFVPSKTNSKLWTIDIQGGGWCYNETLCYERSLTRLGSSKFFPKQSSCGCVNVESGQIASAANIFYICILFIPYIWHASGAVDVYVVTHVRLTPLRPILLKNTLN